MDSGDFLLLPSRFSRKSCAALSSAVVSPDLASQVDLSHFVFDEGFVLLKDIKSLMGAAVTCLFQSHNS